jgi:hypothetical protein
MRNISSAAAALTASGHEKAIQVQSSVYSVCSSLSSVPRSVHGAYSKHKETTTTTTRAERVTLLLFELFSQQADDETRASQKECRACIAMVVDQLVLNERNLLLLRKTVLLSIIEMILYFLRKTLNAATAAAVYITRVVLSSLLTI